MEFWSLPGPRHFVGRVADAVRAGRSVIVRVPDYPALEFEHALRHELDGWYWHALPLTADRPPLDALYQRFLPSVLPDQVRNAYALAQADSMRGTVIQLEGMTAAVWAVWRDFLLEYQNACRMIPETTRGVFVAIVPARIAAEAVVEEIAIATLDFRACVGELDLLPYVGYRLQHRNVVGPRRMLLATALARVALWDAETADRLLEAGPDAIMDPLETLRQIALERGWERLETPSWIVGFNGRGRRRPAGSFGLCGSPRRARFGQPASLERASGGIAPSDRRTASGIDTAGSAMAQAAL
jgi:hypothetical protein